MNMLGNNELVALNVDRGGDDGVVGEDDDDDDNDDDNDHDD